MQTSTIFVAFLSLMALASLLPSTEASVSHLSKKISCKNYHDKCHQNTQICHHKTYRLMMTYLCPTSCSLCNEHIALKAQCQDKLKNCKAELCKHKDYKKMMFKLCRETCKRC